MRFELKVLHVLAAIGISVTLGCGSSGDDSSAETGGSSGAPSGGAAGASGGQSGSSSVDSGVRSDANGGSVGNAGSAGGSATDASAADVSNEAGVDAAQADASAASLDSAAADEANDATVDNAVVEAASDAAAPDASDAGLLIDPNAIYVSTADTASVDDSTCGLGPVGSGPSNHPCKTIAQGIARATTLDRARVLLANGAYGEAITVASGRSLLGGYDPTTWHRDVAATGTLITGVSSNGNHDRTVIATNITSATTLEGLVIYGSVNDKPGGNSYAVYVSGSNANLQIVGNIVFGGRGGPGSNGSIGPDGAIGVNGTGRNPNLSVADALYDAKDATGTGECNTSSNRAYANGGVSTCDGTAVSGGNGGGNRCPVMSSCDTGDANYGCKQATTNFHWTKYTALNGAPGNAGGGASGGSPGSGATSGDDMIQVWATLYGGYICYTPPDTTFGLDGGRGDDGVNGTAIAGCSATTGAVVGGDWIGGGAPTGLTGGNGGGGGGGGAGGGGKCTVTAGHTTCADGGGKDTLGGHGGGGGSGGCGGKGGGGAGAGGGAFDIFIIGSAAPVVTGNQLSRGSGGRGGNGGAGGNAGTGALGALGGTNGVPVLFCTDGAGRGGDGGNGGYGSGGGGGCGGASFAIYTSGVGTPNYCAPAANNAISSGGAGAAGQGGYAVINPGGAGTAGVLQTCSFN